MQRLHIFLAIFTITLSILLTLALVGWYLAVTAPSYYESNWMGEMWSGVTGNNYGGMGDMMNGYETTSYLWIIPVTLATISIVAIVCVTFYLFFPELRYIKRSSCDPQKTEPVTSKNKKIAFATDNSPVSNTCDILLNTMTPEEQKVLNVLVAHQGKYLQKYVSKEAGLSRLKTHRIVARFAQRGIVTVKEFGNTNEIKVSDWIKNVQ